MPNGIRHSSISERLCAKPGRPLAEHALSASIVQPGVKKLRMAEGSQIQSTSSHSRRSQEALASAKLLL